MNKKLFSGLLVMFFVVAPFLVHGATFKDEENYYLAPGLTISDNLYTAGNDVNVSGTVLGDLFTAGGNVVVSGSVEADLFAAGGTLNISGKVAGDERVAGGNITISNSIGGDLMVAGGQVSVLPGSIIEKDVEILGGTVNYSGESNGKLDITGGDVYMNGKVNGDMSIEARSVRLGPDAVVTGNFDYSSPSEVVMEQGAKVNGTTNYNKTVEGKKTESQPFWGFFTFVLMIKFAAIALMSLILVYFFKNQTKAIVEDGVSNFWKKTGKGFIVLIVVPAAVILSFITVIGTPLGIIAMLLYALLLIISGVMANLLFAQLCMKYIFKKEKYNLNWWIVILAVLVFGLISCIPFIGWLFKFIVFLAALGSLTSHAFNKLKD